MSQTLEFIRRLQITGFSTRKGKFERKRKTKNGDQGRTIKHKFAISALARSTGSRISEEGNFKRISCIQSRAWNLNSRLSERRRFLLFAIARECHAVLSMKRCSINVSYRDAGGLSSIRHPFLIEISGSPFQNVLVLIFCLRHSRSDHRTVKTRKLVVVCVAHKYLPWLMLRPWHCFNSRSWFMSRLMFTVREPFSRRSLNFSLNFDTMCEKFNVKF